MRLKLGVAGWLLPIGLVLFGCSENAAPLRQQASGYSTFAPLANTSNIVFVVPVKGMRSPAKLVLADALAASLRDAARPSVVSEKPNPQGPTIFGNISEVRSRGTVAWVTANWELRAPYGETVARVRHEVVVDKRLWQASGVEAVNLLVAEAEPYIIGMVSDYVGPMTATQDVAMPPENSIQMSNGTSQAVTELPVDLIPETGEERRGVNRVNPARPQIDSQPRAAPSPSRVPTTAASPAPAPEIMAQQNNEHLSSEQNALTREDIAVVPPRRQVKAPVRLVPRGLKAAPGEIDASGEAAVEEIPLEEQIVDEATPSISAAEADAKALTDGLLEMADLPKADPVPDNTKLKPVVWGKQSFIVKIVSGAPGDGNERLTSSIKAALRRKDITVTEDPRQAAYEIKGRVVVGTPVNGRQQARIVWRVNGVDGSEVGQAVQENTVIAGSLDGEWGRVAEIVSNAAVDGIQELFDGKRQRRVQSMDTPPFPNVPPLPQVPGRAPPPNG